MRKFTLNPNGTDEYAKASRQALRTYANCINHCDPTLSKEIWDWVNAEIAAKPDEVKKMKTVDFSEPSLSITNKPDYPDSQDPDILQEQWEIYKSWLDEKDTI